MSQMQVERSLRGAHTHLRPLLKVVLKGGWAHSWCPTVVICIFPSKMGAHKPGLVEMQQTWVTSGVSAHWRPFLKEHYNIYAYNI